MKKHFLTGLVILLPTVLTLIIIIFFVNLITNPFVSSTARLFEHYGIFDEPFLFLSSHQVLMLASRVTALLGLALVIFLVGILGRMFFLKYLGWGGEYLIHRIPVVSGIYKGTQEIVMTILGPSKPDAGFSSVVWVPFPHANTLSIGLIISGNLPPESDPEHRELISVFVPGTPNPAMGFMLLFRPDQLIPVGISVEEALKFVVSCGVIYPQTSTENPV